MTEQYDNVREITRLNAHITRQDAENERLRAALIVAWDQVDRNAYGRTYTLATIENAIGHEQNVSGEVSDG